MKLWSALLLPFMLGVSSSCSIPVDQAEKVFGKKEAADFANFPSVSFRVGGMMKTKSGAT